MAAPQMHSGITTDDAMNLAMSPGAVPLYEAVVAFIKNEIDPVTEEYFKLGEGRPDRWQYGKGQLDGISFCPTLKLVKVCRILTMRTSPLNLARTQSHQSV